MSHPRIQFHFDSSKARCALVPLWNALRKGTASFLPLSRLLSSTVAVHRFLKLLTSLLALLCILS